MLLNSRVTFFFSSLLALGFASVQSPFRSNTGAAEADGTGTESIKLSRTRQCACVTLRCRCSSPNLSDESSPVVTGIDEEGIRTNVKTDTAGTVEADGTGTDTISFSPPQCVCVTSPCLCSSSYSSELGPIATGIDDVSPTP